MKGYLKILLPITILSIAVPSGYFLGGYKLVDSHLEKGINKDLDEITENKYTGAIKSTAKKSDLENVNKKMDFIYSKSLKDDISNRTKAIRSQIDLQTTLKEESAQWYAEHTSSSILNKGKIQSDIKKASNILNTSVKKEIVKNNYIVMDRIEYVDMTRQKLDSIKNSQLSESSLPLYYSVSGYLDEMFYSNDKRQMESELKQIKSKIDKSISDSQTNETKSEEEKVKNVKEKTYTFQKSTSIKKDLNDYEFAGFKFLNSTNNVNVLVLSTKENKIYKFKDDILDLVYDFGYKYTDIKVSEKDFISALNYSLLVIKGMNENLEYQLAPVKDDMLETYQREEAALEQNIEKIKKSISEEKESDFLIEQLELHEKILEIRKERAKNLVELNSLDK